MITTTKSDEPRVNGRPRNPSWLNGPSWVVAYHPLMIVRGQSLLRMVSSAMDTKRPITPMIGRILSRPAAGSAAGNRGPPGSVFAIAGILPDCAVESTIGCRNWKATRYSCRKRRADLKTRGRFYAAQSKHSPRGRQMTIARDRRDPSKSNGWRG